MFVAVVGGGGKKTSERYNYFFNPGPALISTPIQYSIVKQYIINLLLYAYFNILFHWNPF